MAIFPISVGIADEVFKVRGQTVRSQRDQMHFCGGGISYVSTRGVEAHLFHILFVVFVVFSANHILAKYDSLFEDIISVFWYRMYFVWLIKIFNGTERRSINTRSSAVAKRPCD